MLLRNIASFLFPLSRKLGKGMGWSNELAEDDSFRCVSGAKTPGALQCTSDFGERPTL
jgi:hypothetical protein